MKNVIKCYLWFFAVIFVFLNWRVLPVELISGNPNAPDGQSFSFGLQQNIQSSSQNNFYVAARPGAGGNGNVNEFALARVSRGKAVFDPITPQLVMLNGIANQANPLFDKGIIALGLLETTEGLFGRLELPVVVTQDEPARLYLFDKLSLPNTIALCSTLLLVRDAVRNVSAGIGGLTTNTTAHVFVAVKPNGGDV